jgi:hypothetical protein
MNRIDKKLFPCTYNNCDKIFSSKKWLEEHIKRQHTIKNDLNSEKVKVEEIANEIGKSNTIVIKKAQELNLSVQSLNSELSIEDADKLFQYMMYNNEVKVCTKKSTFRVVKKKKEKSYICSYDECKKKFLSEDSLKQHIKDKHTLLTSQEKIYFCHYVDCSKFFSSKKGLKKHIKDNHEQDNTLLINSYIKTIMSYNRTLSLVVERRVHDKILNEINNLKKVNYKNCKETEQSLYTKMKTKFKQLKSLKKDKISLKEVLNINCSYCSELFYSQNSLIYHVKDNHVENIEIFLDEHNINKSYCKYCNELIIKDFFPKHYSDCSKIECIYCKTIFYKDEYNEHLFHCLPYKEELWKKDSPIKVGEEQTLTNIEKHQSIKHQFREDEELDPDLIDEKAYQKTFGTELDEKSQRVRDRVAFEYTKLYYKEEEEDKSEIKIFLSKMYKGYCQVCGYTFRKTDGKNSFERFNWNDKRVVKVKKNLVSTADSLCLCRNCSANIKWGAFYPNFVDTIREIEGFKSKSYDEIREKLHKVVDENIPKIFEPLLEFDDVYALEIELDGKPRNIYFTNEHLLQFVTYLQKEDEVEEEVKIKKRKKEIYIKNSWLVRDENIPKELTIDFLKATIYHPNHSSGRPISMSSRAYEMYRNSYHGWAIDLNANPFLVGRAIERCKIEINNYIENKISDFNELKSKLHYCIRGAVATSNNDKYNGYYPLEKGRFMKFGWNAIDVDKGVEFFIREIGLDEFLDI